MAYNRPEIVSKVTRLDKDFFENILDGVEERPTKAEADGTYAAPSLVGRPKGLSRNYSGRKGTPGAGANDQPTLQEALADAVDLTGGDYYNYLTRRSDSVKLPPGSYVISPPAGGGPSLKVIAQYLDASDATIFIDLPAGEDPNWCGIYVGSHGQLRLGKLYNSNRVAAPTSKLIYDAVRVVGTDGGSKVSGYADSEIWGFGTGAAVRLVGAYMTHVRGLRITDNALAVVGGAMGTAFDYKYPNGSTIPVDRRLTDTWLEDLIIVNHKYGNVVLGAQNDEADPNALGLTPEMGSIQSLRNVIIENSPARAVDVRGASLVNLDGVQTENVGNAGGSVMRFDSTRVVNISALRWNNAGTPVPAVGGGTTTVAPARYFQVNSIQSFNLDGFYSYNSHDPAVQFINSDSPPVTHTIKGVITEANEFPVDVLYRGRRHQHFSGAWNGGHPIIKYHHLWRDNAGNLRANDSQPTSDVDGNVVSRKNALSVKTASYTVALVDEGSVLEMDSATAMTVTIPTNATVPLPVGAVMDVYQRQAGQVTIAGESGVTVVSPTGFLKTRAQHSTVRIRKRAADFWVLSGDLSTT